MADATDLPSGRALERFLGLSAALFEGRRWYEGWRILRYAALVLATEERPSGVLAGELRRTATVLRQRARWYSPMQGELGYLIAALLLRAGDDVQGFLDDLERASALMRERALPAGHVHEVLAVMILRANAERRYLSRQEIARFARVYDELTADHRWLTGPDDYPACALLAVTGAAPAEIAFRVERFYRSLRSLGYAPGNSLQTASHVLFFAPEDDTVVGHRFHTLFRAFRGRRLLMHTGDYVEVAVLAMLDAPPEALVDTVLAHRDAIAASTPPPGRELGFDLACGTAFLELADAARIERRQLVLQVQAVLQSQESAVFAGSAPTAVAATS